MEDVPFFARSSPSRPLSSPASQVLHAELPHPVPIFDTYVSTRLSLPPVIRSSPEYHYSHRPRASAPSPDSSRIQVQFLRLLSGALSDCLTQLTSMATLV